MSKSAQVAIGRDRMGLDSRDLRVDLNTGLYAGGCVVVRAYEDARHTPTFPVRLLPSSNPPQVCVPHRQMHGVRFLQTA